jgi:hypothetical protein
MQKRQPRRTKRQAGLPALKKRRRTEAQKVLVRVYRLLEEYGPCWYSLKLRQELQAALKSLR